MTEMMPEMFVKVQNGLDGSSGKGVLQGSFVFKEIVY